MSLSVENLHSLEVFRKDSELRATMRLYHVAESITPANHFVCPPMGQTILSEASLRIFFWPADAQRTDITASSSLVLGMRTVTNTLFSTLATCSSACWCRVLATSLITYALTSSVVVFGVSFRHQFLAPFGSQLVLPAAGTASARLTPAEAFATQDGIWYKMIATDGYYYNPNKRSPVAFFPLYPWLGSAVIRLTGLVPTWALLVVSNVCLAGAFVIAAVYLRSRRPTLDSNTASLTLLALGLMPSTFFFRMTYSESTFLLLCLLFLLGVQRGWPVLVIALIAGLASACRPVGIGLVLPLLLYVWRSSRSWHAFLIRSSLAGPLGCWGLFAYAAFLNAQFGDPLAFAKVQVHWGTEAPSLATKLFSLLSLEPIWALFVDRPEGDWSVFTWALVNPVYFIASAGLIAFGSRRSWLNAYETSLAGVLLVIPYLTRAYEMNMASSARFAGVVFPVYLVLGECLARLPLVVSAGFLCISAFFLGAFSTLFAAGYPIY
jgi:hypothetical protein